MQPTQPSGRSAGRLNVILHGTFAFKNMDANAYPSASARISALIPILDHHVYLAGNWLGETQLLPGTYDLLGVRDGKSRLNKTRNLLVERSNREANPEKIYATLNLPLPAEITSMRVSKIPRRQFQYAGELLLDSDEQHLASLQVFTYDIQDEAELRLQQRQGSGHYWEPAFSGNFINLHIFASEDHHRGPSHAAEDLESALELLGSHIKVNRPFITHDVASDVLPEGVSEEETEDLAPRTRRMARLGRLVLQKGESGQAWYPNEALDDDPPGCGSPGDGERG